MDNVITFPKGNKRLDVTNVPVSVEDVARVIEKMKLDFYHEVADELMDYVVQSIGALNLDSGNTDEVRMREVDIIFLREVLTSFMCRIAGVGHPLNSLADSVVLEVKSDDEGMIDYMLKVPVTQEVKEES